MKQLSPHQKRHLVRIAKWLIATVVLVCIWRSFDSARQAFARDASFSFSEINPWWLGAAGLIYFVGLLPMSLYWQYLIGCLGQRARYGATLRAYYIGHLGKYVPGKALAVVLRTVFLRGERVDATVVTVSVFIETFTMMSVGAGMATALIAWQFSEHALLLFLGGALMILAGIPTWPPFVRWSVRRLKVATWNEDIEQILTGYTWRVMITGWCIELIGWTIVGLSLWAVLKSMPLATPLASPWELWPRLAASVSLSMVAGFLSLLPGGLGVREVVLDQLLKQPFGQIVAPLSAVLLRIVWMLTEVVASAILYMGLSFAARQQAAERRSANS